LVCREISKNGAAFSPHLQAVVLAKPWYRPDGGGGILSVVQVSCIWRALLEGERKSLKPFLGPYLKQLSSNTYWRNFTSITTYVVLYSEVIVTEEKVLERGFISPFTGMIFHMPGESWLPHAITHLSQTKY